MQCLQKGARPAAACLPRSLRGCGMGGETPSRSGRGAATGGGQAVEAEQLLRTSWCAVRTSRRRSQDGERRQVFAVQLCYACAVQSP